MPAVGALLPASVSAASLEKTHPTVFVLIVFLVPIFVIIVIAVLTLRGKRTSGGLVQPFTTERTKALGPDLYEAAKYKLFNDSLEAVSLGAGVKPPKLFVTLFPWPIAYGIDLPVAKKNHFLPIFGTRRHFDEMAVVVSKELLESDLTNNEAEAIMADVVAKIVVSPGQSTKYTLTGHAAKELQVDRGILHKLKQEFSDSIGPEQILLQDTWAARLTGQPGALKSSIIKSRDLLKDRPVVAEFADFYVFVEPTHKWDYGGWTLSEHYRKDDFDVLRALGKSRDLILDLRIENLGKLELLATGQQAKP